MELDVSLLKICFIPKIFQQAIVNHIKNEYIAFINLMTTGYN